MGQSHAADDRKKAQEAEEASEDLAGGNEDPNMNGNYPDPNLTSALPVKRQFRDPYADWWDPQERRNYGETVHEDNDVLGVFSPEAYTHFSTGCFFNSSSKAFKVFVICLSATRVETHSKCLSFV